MKKIKLPLEMANGVMVRSLDELKENWDLEKIVGYFGDGRLVTWLNDRYYTDLAERVQKITAIGAEAQKQLCAAFGMEFKQDEVVDAEAVAERKRKLDILRQFTSDDEILKNIDHVAFNQEDLSDLLDEKVEKIYLCNGKFSVPLNISGKKYIGVADAEVYIGKDELIDFDKLGISFENVKFDEKYQKLVERQYEIEKEKALKEKKPGQIIKFGNYKGEDIEWIILKVQEQKAKVLSRYVLEYLPYDDSPNYIDWKSSITWENSSLRRWLNDDFFVSVFNDTEKEFICESNIVSKGNLGYDHNNREVQFETKDRVFIIDYSEFIDFYENERDNLDFVDTEHYVYGQRKIYVYNEPTQYLKRRLAYEFNLTAVAGVENGWNWLWCWLRSDENLNPGRSYAHGCYESSYTEPMWRSVFTAFHNEYRGIRPAMWIDLNKI